MRTSKPAFARLGMTEGTSAMRRSPGKISLGTPMIIGLQPARAFSDAAVEERGSIFPPFVILSPQTVPWVSDCVIRSGAPPLFPRDDFPRHDPKEDPDGTNQSGTGLFRRQPADFTCRKYGDQSPVLCRSIGFSTGQLGRR